MTVKPILFSAPMVRALLAGTKTQTRRILKPQPIMWGKDDIPYFQEENPCVRPENWNKWHAGHEDPLSYRHFDCPYGRSGGLLWVRESWAPDFDGAPLWMACNSKSFGGEKVKWRPSIHMPRRVSRLTLEITDIDIERLQDISEPDALAEGVPCDAVVNAAGDDYTGLYAHENYMRLWKAINGEKSWYENPWVWVVKFSVHHQNVDDFLRGK